jgi:hypothetical protein
MAVAWEKPVTILLHGLKATTMVVQVSLLRSILYAVIGTGTLGPVAVGSLYIILHTFEILHNIPGQTYYLALSIAFYVYKMKE